MYSNSTEASPAITKYDDILDTTRDMSMVLMDTKDRRAWLVPAQNVLLHMAQCWLHNQRHRDPEASIGHANPDWIGSGAVEELLIRDYRTKLKTRLDDDSDYYLRDLIKDIWLNISGCMIAGKRLRTDERNIITTPSDRIRAWDFFDFVGTNKPSVYYLREQILGYSGCGWEALARDLDLIVLACQDIGEVIQCAPQLNLCDSWRPIPSKMMYLTASISCMQPTRPHLTGDASRKLTETVYWIPSDGEILNECTHDAEAKCHKQVQKVTTSIPPVQNAVTTLSLSGAVIFGRKILQEPQPVVAAAERTAQGSEQPRGSSRWKKFFSRHHRTPERRA